MSALDDARSALESVPELNTDLHIAIRDYHTSVLTSHEVELRAVLRALITEHERMTAPPTDGDREALANLIREEGLTYDQADAILVAGFRRQGPITEAQVEAADLAIMPYWGERYPSGSLTTEIARTALEAARAVS